MNGRGKIMATVGGILILAALLLLVWHYSRPEDYTVGWRGFNMKAGVGLGASDATPLRAKVGTLCGLDSPCERAVPGTGMGGLCDPCDGRYAPARARCGVSAAPHVLASSGPSLVTGSVHQYPSVLHGGRTGKRAVYSGGVANGESWALRGRSLVAEDPMVPDRYPIGNEYCAGPTGTGVRGWVDPVAARYGATAADAIPERWRIPSLGAVFPGYGVSSDPGVVAEGAGCGRPPLEAYSVAAGGAVHLAPESLNHLFVGDHEPKLGWSENEIRGPP